MLRRYARAMAITNLYFDESGYTGNALLDNDQPYFVVASTSIGDDEADALLGSFFPAFKGEEFKFSALWRRASHQQGLLKMVEALPALEPRIFVWVIDKRFCLLAKMVDYLIEPAAYNSGLDFYADQYAPRYVNSAYYMLQPLLGGIIYDRTIRAYDRLARQPSLENVAVFQRAMRASVRRRVRRDRFSTDFVKARRC